MKRLVPFVGLLLAAPALAGKPTAAALAFASSADDGQTLQAEATAALLRDGRIAGVDCAERLDPRSAATRSAAARQGAAKMRAGRAAFENLDLGAAIDAFGEAAQDYASADVRRSFESYVQALTWQAAARWVNGDQAGAHDELVHVFSESPEAPLDKSAFPPDLIDQANRDREEVASGAKVDLQVTATPRGLVWIDGRPVGAAPVTARVAPGRHLLAVSAPGYALLTERVEGPRVDVRLDLVSERAWVEAQRQALAADLEQTRRAAVVRQVMDRLGVDQLLAVGLEGEGDGRSLVAARFASDGHVLAFVRQPVAAGAPLADAAAKVLAAALAQDLPRAADGRPVTDTGIEEPGHGRLGKHGLALIVGGAALASVVAGTIFGIVELHDRSSYAATPQVDVGQTQFWSSVGNRNAVVSDVLDIVGAVGLGAAVAVWFWPQSSSTPASAKTEVFGIAPLPGGAAISAAGRF